MTFVFEKSESDCCLQCSRSSFCWLMKV